MNSFEGCDLNIGEDVMCRFMSDVSIITIKERCSILSPPRQADLHVHE